MKEIDIFKLGFNELEQCSTIFLISSLLRLIKLSEQISNNFFGVQLANSLCKLDRFAAVVEK
jgi:hypothetical protein